MGNIPFEIVQAFVLTLQAYAANPLAVITGGHAPMDFGRNFPDGRRILGKGKTWSGFIGGSLLASVAGIIIYISNLLLGSPMVLYGSGFASAFALVLVMGVSSLSGDAIGSFLKRRIGLESGANASLLDQLPFILFMLLIITVFFTQFSMAVYGNLVGLFTVILITPPMHRAVNIIGFRMRGKDVPW